MEKSDVWGEAKEQIGTSIDKTMADTATLNGRADSVKEQMFDQDLMYQVGDILMSIDSAPSEKWMKCDGTKIIKTHMSTDGGKTFSQFTNSTINSNMPTACDGTTWAITYGGVIYKSTNPTGTWTKVTISDFTPQTQIKYEDGLWQVRGYDSARGSYVILTSKSLTGTWNRTYVDNYASDYYYVDDDNYIYYDGNNDIYTPYVKNSPLSHRPVSSLTT